MSTDIAVEKQKHAGHVLILAVFFKEHPHCLVTRETLQQLVGDNYQQRISELRRSKLL